MSEEEKQNINSESSGDQIISEKEKCDLIQNLHESNDKKVSITSVAMNRQDFSELKNQDKIKPDLISLLQQNIGGEPVYVQVYPVSVPPYRDWDGWESYHSDLFDTTNVRNRFIQRVYTILSVQLFCTFAFVCLGVFQNDVKYFLRHNMILWIVALVVYIVTYFILICYRSLRLMVPYNFIMLGIMTISLTYLCATISCMYETYIVLTTVGITMTITILISIFAIQTSWDVTKYGMCLCVLGLVVFLFGLISTIVYFVTHSNILFIIYSGIAALLFCAYLMYDTQLIIGGRRFEMTPDDYICGALTLYVDIINIFLDILRLFK